MVPAAPQGSRHGDARERQLSWGVASLAIAAPAAIGGAHPSTQIMLSTVALGLFCAAVLIQGERGVRRVAFAGIAALALAFTVFQALPLPRALVRLLSPHSYELHNDVDPTATWMTISIDGAATWLACARAIGCTALLLVVGGFIRRRSTTRLLVVIAATAAGLAVVAVAQRLSGASTILGFYHPRSQPGFGVFGTFVNVNHAASMLALGGLVAVGLAVEAEGRRRVLFGVLALLSNGAVLLTTSRGGLFALGVGAFVFVAIVAARSVGTVRALVVAGLLLIGSAGTIVWANGELRHRVGDQTALVYNQKTRGWADGLRAATAYAWTGLGRGAFETGIGAFRSNDEGVRLVYPEDIVVQMASEWGIPISFLLIAMFLTTAARLAPSVGRATPSIVGAACGVLAVITHDAMDFGLEFPGVAFPTVITLGAVVSRVAIAGREQSQRRQRLSARTVGAATAGAVAVLAVAAYFAGHSVDADFAAIHDQLEAHNLDEATLRAAIVRHPADDYLELLAAKRAYEQGQADALRHVNRALLLHPTNWQAHRLAALMLVSLNRPAQAALEYQLALENGMTFDPRELVRVLRMHVVEAVPQTPTRLLELAKLLYAMHMNLEADAAARRAVDVGQAEEPWLIARTRLAVDASASDAIRSSAAALVAQAQSVDGFRVAAQAYSRLGAYGKVDVVVEQGLRKYPGNAALLLTAVEARLAAGDLERAGAALTRATGVSLTLAERKRVEDLSAEIADRRGDVEAAIVARARSRLIAKELQDMTGQGRTSE